MMNDIEDTRKEMLIKTFSPGQLADQIIFLERIVSVTEKEIMDNIIRIMEKKDNEQTKCGEK